MAIKYDLSDIPKNATISKATLSVYVYANGEKLGVGGYPRNAPKSVYRITDSWSQSNITWNSKPSSNNTVLDSSINTSINIWEDFNVTSAIKDMVENGGDNNGFLIKFPLELKYSYLGARIWSSEYSTANLRPKLTISYSTEVTSIKPVSHAINQGECSVILTNLQGRKIASYTSDNINSITKFNSLPAGVHLLHITTKQKTFTKKVSIIK